MPMAMRAPDQPVEVVALDQALAASRRVLGVVSGWSTGSGEDGFGTVLDMSISVRGEVLPEMRHVQSRPSRPTAPAFRRDPPDGIRRSVARPGEDR
ncbi:hypothetical protein GCM10009868_03220 [Terrabacter aerolatus]|uniref:Uncharacterized protein n=1 Tax=Terrabacter aerolatus TaxID=422442 RepID=A0A512D5N3_9MICO|nr:hypothetical protein TAE01_35830 [Terrabacter aerolatus]